MAEAHLPIFRARLFSAMLLATVHGAAVAEAPVLAMTEADFFQPLPTVLTAARLVQPLTDAPAAMTVIDRDMIDASSATNIADLLRLAPGFQVTYTEGIEAIPTYHGFADQYPKRMQVLVDGRAIYNPGYNGVIWASLPLTINDIDRIEIVRGPNAAAYGSNAFLGTVNIVTRRPETRDRVEMRTMLGSNATREIEVGFADQGDGYAFGITGSFSENDGFDDKDDDNVSRLFNATATVYPNTRDSLTFQVGARDTAFDSESFRFPRDRQYRSHYQQVVWDRTLSATEDLSVQAFHSAFDNPDTTTFGNPATRVDYSVATHRYDLEIQHRWMPTDGWRVSWGGGLRRDTVRGKGAFDRDDEIERDMARLFANVEWRPDPGVAVNAGLMAEHFDALGNYLSPRLAVNWKVAPRQTLRASVARAYRMPNFLEQRGELKIDILAVPGYPEGYFFIGDRDNEPEQIDSFELGYLWDVPGWNGVVDLRLFHNEVTGVLYEIRDQDLPNGVLPTDILRYGEAGSVRTTGLELQATLRPTPDWLLHLAYAYARADGGYVTKIENGVPDPDARGNPRPAEPSVPEHTLTLMAARDFGDGWRLSGTAYHVSEMEWLGEGHFVDRVARFDAKLSKRFRHPAGDVQISLNVQNLLDDPYWEFTPSFPDDGIAGNLGERRIYAEIRLDLR